MIDEEAVIIHLDSSSYFGLNPSGASIWSRLVETACTPVEVAEWLSARYRIRPDQAHNEAKAFLEQLAQAELLQEGTVAQSPAASDTEPVGSLDEYQAPELVRFGDLNTLILSAE